MVMCSRRLGSRPSVCVSRVNDYDQVVSRLKRLDAPCHLKTLDTIAGHPIYAVVVNPDADRVKIWVNAGTHGDEPAGVEAALRMLEEWDRELYPATQLLVTPCLNPYGYVHDQRENAQGVDANWAFKRDDVPEVGVVKQIIQERFDAIIDLHEDWESDGYYLYEQIRDRNALGPGITERVSPHCPINGRPEIEGEIALGGVIHPDLELQKRKCGKGVPVEVFKRATNHQITLESPSGFPIDARVEAHLKAIDVVLEAYASERRDLSHARLKPGYVLEPESITEPELTDEDWKDLSEGIRLFNAGAYWESHEAWELVWRRRNEPTRVFFQALIQFAAAYHQLDRGVYHGVVKHMRNASTKLASFPDRFLGVEVGPVKSSLELCLDEALRLGEGKLSTFDRRLVLRIDFNAPEP